MDYIDDVVLTREQAEDPGLYDQLSLVLFDLAFDYEEELIQMWIDDHQEAEVPPPAIAKKPRTNPAPGPALETIKQNVSATPRHGYVYLLAGGNCYKIGITSKKVEERLKSIQAQSPVEVQIVHYFESEYYRDVERYLHNRFADKRTHYEWFDLSADDVNWLKTIGDYGLDDALD